MALKDIWSQTNKWLRNHKLVRPLHTQPELDEEGLILQNTDTESPEKSSQTYPQRYYRSQVIIICF